MLPVERMQFIMERLEENQSVVVEDLAAQLQVTAMTIRRDLEKLEMQNRLQRTHGGAIPIGSLSQEKHYAKKQKQNISAKRGIAQRAVKLISDGQIIFLDAGTTTYELAMEIKNAQLKDITIVTNDLDIAYNLHKETTLKVILLGGEVQKSTGALIGQLATVSASSIYVDIAFLAARSISEDFHLLTPSEGKVSLKKAMLNAAEKRVLLVDASKFNTRAFYKTVHLKGFEYIITDYRFNPEERETLENYHVKIFNI